MASCTRCGERNPEAARFCAACGAELPAAHAMPLETRRMVTVLFCDVSGSTALGERQDPEQIRRVMSRYFDASREVLERHGGTVEKFIGDAVVALFGVPVLHEDDALRAVRAAAELRDRIDELNDELERTYGIRIAVRIGVNSGEVIAGDTLGGHSFAAGDAVNVAQRLEASAEVGEILIGEMTHTLARDAIRAESTGPLQLKGREEPVTAFRLLEVLPGVPSHVRRFDSPMIGRERELQVLADAFVRAVAERSCHLFTVLGAAGVGKSRLVREAVAQVGDRARLLVGTCLPYGEGITFWPALEVVKQGTGIVDGDSVDQATAKIEAMLAGDEAARLAAERVAALVGLEESGETAEQGFWGLRKLVEALAREQPTMLVFDDVNSGEPRFLDLVEYLAERTRDAPLLIVCMARPELLEARPAWAGGKRNATTIFLEPLSRDESRTLLDNLLAVDIDDELVARIQQSAEGNPLFVEEMVSMLIDGGYLGPGADSGSAALERLPVPASIQVLLASRLDQLSSGERQMIERAAVEGTVFHSGAVAALADEALGGDVDACLDSLVRKELIVPYQASFAGVDGFRFRHVLIREAAYDAVPKQLRADLHERYAGWLGNVSGERLPELEEVLGYHLEQAYRYRLDVLRADDHGSALALAAATHLGAAGCRALARRDAGAAVNLLDRAVGLLPADDPDRIPLVFQLAEALHDVGEFRAKLDLLEDVLARSVEEGDELTAAAARLEIVHGRLYDAEPVSLEENPPRGRGGCGRLRACGRRCQACPCTSSRRGRALPPVPGRAGRGCARTRAGAGPPSRRRPGGRADPEQPPPRGRDRPDAGGAGHSALRGAPVRLGRRSVDSGGGGKRTRVPRGDARAVRRGACPRRTQPGDSGGVRAPRGDGRPERVERAGGDARDRAGGGGAAVAIVLRHARRARRDGEPVDDRRVPRRRRPRTGAERRGRGVDRCERACRGSRRRHDTRRVADRALALARAGG